MQKPQAKSQTKRKAKRVQTNQPISTISYNSPQWFSDVLERLVNGGIVDWAYFISHKGENGLKDHIHAYIVPNRRVDTSALRREFFEPDPPNPKPLGCEPFVKSVLSHWLRYAVHDPLYLKMHHSDNDGDGKIPYKVSDISIVNVSDDQLQRHWKTSEEVVKTKQLTAVKRLANGGSALDTVLVDGLQPTQAAFLLNLFTNSGRTSDVVQMLSGLDDIQIADSMRQIKAIADKNGIALSEKKSDEN